MLDSAGSPIAGAQLQVVGLLGRGSTGVDGAFILAGVPTGPRVLRVRRLGFSPDSVQVEITPGGETKVEVRLAALPQQVDAVVVEARQRPMYTGRLARFWERRDRGVGCVAARREDLASNPRRDRVVGHDHALLAANDDGRLVRPDGGLRTGVIRGGGVGTRRRRLRRRCRRYRRSRRGCGRRASGATEKDEEKRGGSSDAGDHRP